MANESRMVGIDLFRGIAVFAVVIIHADLGTLIVPSDWKYITEFASFAVPFFLATSFYLTTQRLHVSEKPDYFQKRTLRILVPYIFWSVLYLIYRASKYIVIGNTSRLSSLLEDPISVIFFGGASFHLYFLPLLLSGLILIKILENLIKAKIRLGIIAIFCIGSIICYKLTLSSGNEFQPGVYIAFPSLLNDILINNNFIWRILLVELAWIIRCLPYILFAVLLTHPWLEERLLKLMKKQTIAVMLLVAFLIINSFGGYFMSESLHELLRGYLALLSAVSLSNWLKNNDLIKNLSICSFGIYLAHVIVLELFQSIEKKMYAGSGFRTSAPNLMLFSIAIFLITYINVRLFTSRQKTISRLMFGT